MQKSLPLQRGGEEGEWWKEKFKGASFESLLFYFWKSKKYCKILRFNESKYMGFDYIILHTFHVLEIFP